MLPSHEGLVAEHLPGRQPRYRLIVENEVACTALAIDRASELRFQLETTDRCNAHLRLERSGAGFSFRLRAVEREVCVPENVIGSLMRAQRGDSRSEERRVGKVWSARGER